MGVMSEGDQTGGFNVTTPMFAFYLGKFNAHYGNSEQEGAVSLATWIYLLHQM